MSDDDRRKVKSCNVVRNATGILGAGFWYGLLVNRRALTPGSLPSLVGGATMVRKEYEYVESVCQVSKC